MDPLLSVEWIPSGDPGAWLTLGRMRELVAADCRDAGLVQHGRQVVSAAGLTPEETIHAIGDVLTQRIRYTHDPVAMDLLQTPRQMLAQLGTRGVARGDCDDVAMLAAFLGCVHGIAYRFRAVGPDPGGPLIHVYALLRAPGGWVTLDTTRNARQVLPAEARALEVDGG